MVNKPVKGYSQEQLNKQKDKEEADFRYLTNLALIEVRSKIQELFENQSKVISSVESEKVYLRSAFDVFIDSVKSEKAMVFSKVGDLSTEMAFFFNDCRLLLNRHVEKFVSKESQENDIDEVRKRVAKMESEIEKFKAEMRSLVHSLAGDFDRKLSSFRHEILNKPSEIPAVKKELEEKIDLVALDGTNSILRTQNCEKQLVLIEKKIEQIYLLIKKLELSKEP